MRDAVQWNAHTAFPHCSFAVQCHSHSGQMSGYSALKPALKLALKLEISKIYTFIVFNVFLMDLLNNLETWCLTVSMIRPNPG